MRRSPLTRTTPLHQRSERPRAVEQRRRDAEWRAAVLALYAGCCVLCGRAGTQAHHCYTRGSRPDLRHELHNGLPLCGTCHRRVHDTSELLRALRVVADEQRRAIAGEREPLMLGEIRAIVAAEGGIRHGHPGRPGPASAGG